MPPPVLECMQQIFLPADAAFLMPVISTIFNLTHFALGVKVMFECVSDTNKASLSYIKYDFYQFFCYPNILSHFQFNLFYKERFSNHGGNHYC
jgi:hypothetical protein